MPKDDVRQMWLGESPDGPPTAARKGRRPIRAPAPLPDTPRGLRIVLDGSFYHEWIVGCADPESVARQITADPALPG